MMNKKWFVNGDRVSGQAFRKLVEVYENQITELESKLNIANTNIENFLGQIADLARENAELKADMQRIMEIVRKYASD